jgi:hypothetical protein
MCGARCRHSACEEIQAVATTKPVNEGVFQTVLENYLVSQARTVEASVYRGLRALLERNERLASEVFLTDRASTKWKS